eukprot:COSAG02_NODE_8465_length_2563_cov_2.666802_1_plen_193_part_00
MSLDATFASINPCLIWPWMSPTADALLGTKTVECAVPPTSLSMSVYCVTIMSCMISAGDVPMTPSFCATTRAGDFVYTCQSNYLCETCTMGKRPGKLGTGTRWPSRGRGAREIIDALSALPPKPLPHYLHHATQARATPPPSQRDQQKQSAPLGPHAQPAGAPASPRHQPPKSVRSDGEKARRPCSGSTTKF